MENHPIPQDITGFQFKLIGNMTVKQFAYLAAGVVLGWITYAMPIPLLIKLPVALVFAGTGASFAFLPVDGRPLDVMITNFTKALSSPTQYIYQKLGANLYFPEYKPSAQMANTTTTPVQSSLSGDKLKAFLASLPTRPKNKLDEKEITFLQALSAFPVPGIQPKQSQQGLHLDLPTFNSFFGGAQPAQAPQPVQKADAPPVVKQEGSEENDQMLLKQAEILKAQLEDAKKQEASKTSGSREQEEAHQKVASLENLLSETMHQKQQLENQLIELQKKLEQQNKKVFSPSMATPEPKMEQTKHVRSIPAGMGKSIGLPVTPEFPNVITGIVKDPRGNTLPGILVEVKDGDGNPIRAFKTSPLGQFASATPLSNGTYTIDFEDPSKKNRFDTIEFSAQGEIILPIEVISIDEREEIRQSLFGQK
jgi:hypothetical protein